MRARPGRAAPQTFEDLDPSPARRLRGVAVPALCECRAGSDRRHPVDCVADAAHGGRGGQAARRPGFEVGSWFGFVLPAKLPDAIARRLAANVAEILALPEVKARFDGLGMETAAQTPAPFNAFIAQEFAKWRKVIKRAGIEAQ